MTTLQDCVRAALSRFSARTTALAVAAVAVIAGGSMAVTVPASGSPSRAAALITAARPQLPAAASYARAPAVDKSGAASAQRASWTAAQAAEALAVREHESHLAHLAHVASERQAAQAAEAARQRPSTSVGAPATGSNVPAASVAPSGGYSVSSAFQACVIRAESGGNPQIWNGSGHWGLYQFSYDTWVRHGGSPSLFGHAGGVYQTEIFWNTVRQDGGSDWSPYDGCPFSGSAPATTTASVTPSGGSTASRALAWALTQAGKWYQWGGFGPSTYDCSGLVMTAYAQEGVSLPHNTVAMLDSGKLVSTSSPQPGDLVMWGGSSPYHVEIYVRSGETFGAHQSGTQVGYASLWGSPSYYRVA